MEFPSKICRGIEFGVGRPLRFPDIFEAFERRFYWLMQLFSVMANRSAPCAIQKSHNNWKLRHPCPFIRYPPAFSKSIMMFVTIPPLQAEIAVLPISLGAYEYFTTLNFSSYLGFSSVLSSARRDFMRSMSFSTSCTWDLCSRTALSLISQVSVTSIVVLG